MKLSKALRKVREEAAKSPEFWVERAKLDFAVSLEEQRRASRMTYKQIADAIRSSAAYVSKVFRGDSNLTIESMVRLAAAAGGRVEIRVTPRDAEVVTPTWRDREVLARASKPRIYLVSSTTVDTTQPCANNQWFQVPDATRTA